MHGSVEGGGEGPEAEADPTAPRVFRGLLLNTLVTGISSSFLWFALTFWVYLRTRSVVATGVIGAAFSISSALVGPAFGTYVDRHRKKQAMWLSTVASMVCFVLATTVFLAVDADSLLRLRSPWFWILVGSTLLGSVAGSMRGIVLSTCVTLLVPEESRDKANGLVGTVTGVSFAITSVFSGLVIGQLGMGWAYYLSLTLVAGALVHLATIHIPEEAPAVAGEPGPHVDVRGALVAIRAVPGLMMLVLLAGFNNLLGGVFIALVDAYGLALVSVETWGFLWGGISMAFIAGGLLVARFGLGRVPLRLILLGNLVNWVMCSVFALRSSIVLLVAGMVVWLALIPVIEAAEQTVLQRSIPFEQQGRVFGFAQLVENSAAPVVAILIGPIAEVAFIPFMDEGGRGADLIGGWFGVGPERGLALIFVVAGLIGIAVTLAARASGSYRRLVADWVATPAPTTT